MRIRLTRSATRDLDAIEAHIAEDNPKAAVRTVLRVLEAIEGLSEFPNVGRPGRVPGTRELVVGGTPFITVYKVETNTLWVARVLHGAQRWPE
ncbi:MAG: hypothetical protein A2289_23340 [Deltaproteobacteria bacterium RIFOXYA12_FULL_58_15]|nr:MAG: hypothetical protein A2289_23340 [Deltaproteobacteria bacterium RIFOXYA12_FULL_58_15]OGR13293.1 MAG: hypothetical protein A2341_16155 [Deltaproteobacteria bacterium RIFOXYB12_FULL_58_9]